MDKILSDGWRELQTLAQFAAGLDDNHTVYHGVRWTHVELGSYAIHSRPNSLAQPGRRAKSS
jgi:hypothetical protein